MTTFPASKFLLSALIIVFPVICLSQANYKNGVIVYSKGDTTLGLIDLKEWEKTPQVISFKKDENSNSEKLGLDELRFFAITGDGSFERHRVNISLGAIELADLSVT